MYTVLHCLRTYTHCISKCTFYEFWSCGFQYHMLGYTLKYMFSWQGNIFLKLGIWSLFKIFYSIWWDVLNNVVNPTCWIFLWLIHELYAGFTWIQYDNFVQLIFREDVVIFCRLKLQFYWHSMFLSWYVFFYLPFQEETMR